MTGSLSGLLKPCYLFAPASLVRRLYLHFAWPESARADVDLPWGMSIEVNLKDMIGVEIFKQRIFDLAVSECAWRLLARGDRVIDAGANIGYMTMLFAARVGGSGIVHAFEPHPRVRALLERNVARIRQHEDAPQIEVHACALGRSRGNAELIETDHFGANEGSARIAHASERIENKANSHAVQVETLDGLFPDESFTLLKIDVEGFEQEVLEGALGLLSARRIRHVIFEDNSRIKSELPDLLSRYGYTIFSIGYGTLGPRLLRSSEGPIEIDASWESASFVATLVPEEVTTLMSAKGWRVLKGA